MLAGVTINGKPIAEFAGEAQYAVGATVPTPHVVEELDYPIEGIALTATVLSVEWDYERGYIYTLEADAYTRRACKAGAGPDTIVRLEVAESEIPGEA